MGENDVSLRVLSMGFPEIKIKEQPPLPSTIKSWLNVLKLRFSLLSTAVVASIIVASFAAYVHEKDLVSTSSFYVCFALFILFFSFAFALLMWTASYCVKIANVLTQEKLAQPLGTLPGDICIAEELLSFTELDEVKVYLANVKAQQRSLLVLEYHELRRFYETREQREKEEKRVNFVAEAQKLINDTSKI